MTKLLQKPILIKELSELHDFVQLSEMGLASALSEPDLLDAMESANKAMTKKLYGDDDLAERKAKSQRRFESAKFHRDSEFRYLYSLAIIKLWSILEATIDEITIEALSRADECDMEFLKTIRGPIFEILFADEAGRIDFIVDEIKQKVKSSLKKGVDGLEAILETIKLSGTVDREIKKNLRELQQVRHSIVHRNGSADKRFVESVPWMGELTNQSILINRTSFSKYSLSSLAYALELERRIYRRAQVDIPNELETSYEYVRQKIVKN